MCGERGSITCGARAARNVLRVALSSNSSPDQPFENENTENRTRARAEGSRVEMWFAIVCTGVTFPCMVIFYVLSMAIKKSVR